MESTHQNRTEEGEITACGNCFLTRKEAEKELEKRKAIQRVKKYIWENDLEFEPDWSDLNQLKYDIYYDFTEKRFYPNASDEVRNYSPIGYFVDETDAHQVIYNCKDDLKIIFDIDQDLPF